MSRYRWLPVVTGVFVTSLILSNIIAVKLVSIGPLFLTSAIIIFPVSYVFGDVLTEVYGYSRARQVIWIGFGCNLLAVLAIWASIQLPGAPFWHMGSFENPQTSQQAYEAVFGFTPRLLVASFIAYLVGEFLNSFVLAKMKIATSGRYLWARTIGSTLVGQLADTGIFTVTAFLGVIPTGHLFTMVVTQWLVKSLYEASATPFTYLVVNFLKTAEHEDCYDRETKFSPFVWDEKN